MKLGKFGSIQPPLWLAPMEGVTDRSFRALIVEGNPGSLGATCTEFLRITNHPLPVERLRKELGEKLPDSDVAAGIQLMAREEDVLAETALHAAEAGADFIDLNFGCPAPRVFQHGAGSALLCDPPRVASLVRAAVQACPVPVTAKIRAGVDHDEHLEEIVQRIEQAGASAICVHGRLRIEPYSAPTDWSRIARAVQAVQIPIIGNGSADTPERIRAMPKETGCAGVMIGHGAIADPWIFARAMNSTKVPEVGNSQAGRAWLEDYAGRMANRGALPRHVAGRLKQAVKGMTAAGWFQPKDGLATWLRLADPKELLGALSA